MRRRAMSDIGSEALASQKSGTKVPPPNGTDTLVSDNGWRECKLGDVIDVKHGYAFKGGNITTEKTQDILVTPGNFHIGGGFKTSKFKYFNGNYPKDYILNKDDIVVTMTDLSKEGDTLGYSAKIPECCNCNYLHNQRIGLVKFISGEVDKNFIYWLMRTRDYQTFIVGSATGTSVRHTSPKLIKEYEFELPSLEEQKAIAEVLSSLDDKIDLLHRQNRTLESLAQTLFRQWLIEEAKDEWEITTLCNLGKVVTGKTPSTNNEDFWGDSIPFITPTDFKNYNKYAFTAERSLSALGKDKVKNSVLPKNSILVTCIGSDMGKVAIAQNECVTNQQINSLVLENDNLLNEYVFQYLKSIYPLLRAIALGGTTMPIINKTDFENIEIILPSDEALKNFHKTTICECRIS